VNLAEFQDRIEPIEMTYNDLDDLMAHMADPRLRLDNRAPYGFLLQAFVPIRLVDPSIPSPEQVQ